ncbi:hypothetical protein NWFMUON74_19250 [Nocardia wallacei]|uniref:Uncharacterized protein n=1 Tax=Nocardia wallacei TaxID=480035 RepID=A0A7G1KJ19_9NOCA|nr:hypothetical protein NWFMUON74_19250 [Nocardia wallacei]
MLASSWDPWAQPVSSVTAAIAAKLPARKRRAWRWLRAMVFRAESTSLTGMREGYTEHPRGPNDATATSRLRQRVGPGAMRCDSTVYDAS